MTSQAVRFMKHHELGHFVRGHMRCNLTPIELPGYTEREADCWAVAELLPQGQTGRSAIDAAANYFYTRRDPPRPPYESSVNRSKYIRALCQ